MLTAIHVAVTLSFACATSQMTDVPTQPNSLTLGSGQKDPQSCSEHGDFPSGEEGGRLAKEVKQLFARAVAFAQAGSHAEAIPFARKALELHECLVGPDRPEAVEYLAFLAQQHEVLRDLPEARATLERALRIQDGALGPHRTGAVLVVQHLVRVLWDMGLFDTARPLLERLVNHVEKPSEAHEALHPTVIEGFSVYYEMLAMAFFTAGEFESCRAWYERTIAFRTKLKGSDHPEVIATMTNFVALLSIFDQKSTRPIYERLLSVQEKLLGHEDPRVAAVRRELLFVLSAIRDLPAFRRLYVQVVSDGERMYGGNPDALVELLRLVARNLESLGDLDAARPLVHRALSISEKMFGTQDDRTALSLHDLGRLAVAMGAPHSARRFLERSLHILEANGSQDRLPISAVRDDLAAVAMNLRDIRTAERLVNDADRSDVCGNKQEYFELCGQLLQTYRNLLGARRAMELALTHNKRLFGLNHPNTARTLTNLGSLLRVSGDLRGAREHLQRALAIREKVLGSDSAETADSLVNLALLDLAQGREVSAIRRMERVLSIEERYLRTLMGSGTEHEKQSSFASFQHSTDIALSLALRRTWIASASGDKFYAPASDVGIVLAFEALLGRKARVLEATAAQNARIRRDLPPEDRPLLDELRSWQSRLSNLVRGCPEINT